MGSGILKNACPLLIYLFGKPAQVCRIPSCPLPHLLPSTPTGFLSDSVNLNLSYSRATILCRILLGRLPRPWITAATMWRWLHLISFSLNIMWPGACGDDDLALGQVLRLDVAQRASEASAHLPGQRNHGEKLYGEELQVCILKSCQKQKKQNSLPFLFQWDRTCWCAPHEERTTGPAAGIVLGSHLKKSFTILSARAWRQWTQAPATPWQTWSLALWRNLQHSPRARWHFRWTDNPKSLLQWC